MIDFHTHQRHGRLDFDSFERVDVLGPISDAAKHVAPSIRAHALANSNSEKGHK